MATSTISKRLKHPNDTGKSLSSWLLPALTSTVGSKFLVALTGLALTGFVYVHMAGNLLVFKGSDALNEYAQFLKDRGPLLWFARLGLLATFVLHLTLALRLKLRNKAARPVPYQFPQTVQASFASRTMALTGLVVLAFVLFHLAHYTFGWLTQGVDRSGVVTNYMNMHDAKGRHDVYAMVINGFRNPVVVLLYVVAQVMLGLHLSHGIASTFQSLGWDSPRFAPTIKKIGIALASILALVNIIIPLAVLLGFVGSEIPSPR